MSIKKQVLKSKSICKVNFRFTKEMASGADKVALVGDFNNWDTEALEMKKLKTGDFTCLLELETGKSYEFRYLVNGKDWVNDSEADRFVATNLGVENCVVEAI